MNQPCISHEVRLTIPADMAYAPVASLALSGLGMVMGLDVDLLGDLRTVTTEAIDCLLHQAGRPERISLSAYEQEGRLIVQFAAVERERVCEQDNLALEITRGVLETLMPEVSLFSDEDGVHGIECSMPV